MLVDVLFFLLLTLKIYPEQHVSHESNVSEYNFEPMFAYCISTHVHSCCINKCYVHYADNKSAFLKIWDHNFKHAFCFRKNGLNYVWNGLNKSQEFWISIYQVLDLFLTLNLYSTLDQLDNMVMCSSLSCERYSSHGGIAFWVKFLSCQSFIVWRRVYIF